MTTAATLKQRPSGLNGAPDYSPMVMKILYELADGDLNTLDRFYNWHATQPEQDSIFKWAADYRKAELKQTYPMRLSDKWA